MPLLESITYGPAALLVEGPKENQTAVGELDTVAIELLCDHPWRDGAEAAGYGHRSKISGYHSMWVQAASGQQESADTALATIQCVGLLEEGEKRKRTLSAVGRLVSIGPIEKVVIVVRDGETGTDGETGDPVTAKRKIPKLDTDGDVLYKAITTPSGSYDRWNINDPLLSLSDVYFTTTKPDTTQQGTALTPPDAPTPPDYPWGSYSEPMRAQHPNGWVLDEREIECLFANSDEDGLWMVTDHFAYYWLAVPD